MIIENFALFSLARIFSICCKRVGKRILGQNVEFDVSSLVQRVPSPTVARSVGFPLVQGQLAKRQGGSRPQGCTHCTLPILVIGWLLPLQEKLSQ